MGYHWIMSVRMSTKWVAMVVMLAGCGGAPYTLGAGETGDGGAQPVARGDEESGSQPVDHGAGDATPVTPAVTTDAGVDAEAGVDAGQASGSSSGGSDSGEVDSPFSSLDSSSGADSGGDDAGTSLCCFQSNSVLPNKCGNPGVTCRGIGSACEVVSSQAPFVLEYYGTTKVCM